MKSSFGTKPPKFLFSWVKIFSVDSPPMSCDCFLCVDRLKIDFLKTRNFTLRHLWRALILVKNHAAFHTRWRYQGKPKLPSWGRGKNCYENRISRAIPEKKKSQSRKWIECGAFSDPINPSNGGSDRERFLQSTEREQIINKSLIEVPRRLWADETLWSVASLTWIIILLSPKLNYIRLA